MIAHPLRTMKPLLIFSLFFFAAPLLPAQQNGIEQDSELITVSAGDKFLRWYGYDGRSYFLQVSDANDPLGKWNWAPIIESGNDEDISYEVDGTAPKSFFRLKYTDQVPGPNETLDTADFDHDGMSNIGEIDPPAPLLASDATDPLDSDTDDDGMTDGYERTHGLDPNDDGSTDPDNGPNGDPDGDGLTNAQELALTTEPNDPDTDDDGLNDGEEVALTTDPKNPNSDSDSLLDGEDADPKEILVDWQKTSESSYLLIEVDAPLAEGDPTDLNDKGEVLFKNGIWSAGEWLPLETPENIAGSFPTGGEEEQGYVIRFDPTEYPGGFQYFDGSHNLAGFSSIELGGPDEPEFSSVFAEFSGQSAQDLAITELLPVYRSSGYGLRLFGIKSDLTVVAGLRYTLDNSSTPTLIHSKLVLFPAGGASPVLQNLPGDTNFRNPFYSDNLVTPFGWIACHTQAGSSAQGSGAALWDAAGGSKTLPAAASTEYHMIHLSDLPKGNAPASGANAGFVASNVTGESLVLLPDGTGEMQEVESMSGKQLKLLSPDGTGMTHFHETESEGQTVPTLELWRNGKLIPLRDLCPKIGELLDQGYRLFPQKANKHGMYLIKAEGPNGEILTKLLVGARFKLRNTAADFEKGWDNTNPLKPWTSCGVDRKKPDGSAWPNSIVGLVIDGCTPELGNLLELVQAPVNGDIVYVTLTDQTIQGVQTLFNIQGALATPAGGCQIIVREKANHANKSGPLNVHVFAPRLVKFQVYSASPTANAPPGITPATLSQIKTELNVTYNEQANIKFEELQANVINVNDIEGVFDRAGSVPAAKTGVLRNRINDVNEAAHLKIILVRSLVPSDTNSRDIVGFAGIGNDWEVLEVGVSSRVFAHETGHSFALTTEAGIDGKHHENILIKAADGGKPLMNEAEGTTRWIKHLDWKTANSEAATGRYGN